MPDEPPRLFLSYGVHDASELAERLRRDLTARGYQVWQDVNRIRAGLPWDEEVQTGLRNSQVLLALLSPQSVRRARDAGNPTATDSVCLDEIEYAQRACKIPIVPVQVVSCEAPFLIFRLHQINFRYWRESEATYQAGLNQICAAIAEAIQSRKSPERLWTPSLEPWDFAPFLLEKRNHFTGRQWLFRDLDEWRRKETPPALLITGEPGIGKSAIVAALVHENREGQVLAYHCCRADTPATLEPARFVRSLAGMLAARLEGYAAMLEDAGIKDALERADSDPASAFEAAVLSPLHSVPRTLGDRRYLLIDALDEALTHSKRPTIVEVLAARINRLPPWLGIVATTRSEAGVLRQLRGLPAQALKADDPKNQDDVLAFLHLRLSKPSLLNKVEASGRTSAELVTNVLRASAGNFLFAATLLDAVETNQLSLDEIEGLPPGLGSLYEIFFNRIFRDTGVGFGPSRLVFEAVVAAREPLNREQLAALSGLDGEGEVPVILARLASFLPFRDRTYVLFHRSLFEWLTEWDSQQDQPVAGPYHISLKRGRSRLADWCFVEYKRDPANAPIYCLKHLIAHLHEVGRDDEVKATLLDFNFLEAKFSATDADALIADYDYLPEDKDLQLVQSAIRLSANILIRDQRQLASQLTGRLVDSANTVIEALLTHVLEKAPRPWLRALKPSLTAPGGPLIRILEDDCGSGRSVAAYAVNAAAVTPDSRHVVSDSYDHTVRVWDLATGETITTLQGHTDSVKAVAVTPDGRHVVSGSDDHTLRVWDLATGKTKTTLQGHTGPVTAVAVTPDGRHVVSGSRDHTLRVWDLANGETITRLRGHAGSVEAVAVTPDGRCVVSGSEDKTLRVWDLATGETIRTLQGHTSDVTAVAVTPDGRHAVSGSYDKTLRVWDLATGETKTTLQGHTHWVRAVAVTPDGRHVVSGSCDKTLRVWDLATGETKTTLQGHTNSVNAVAVTPDGRHVVSGSWDRTLRVWDLATGETKTMLQGHTSSVNAVAVTPDGRHVVSGSDDNTLRVWDLATGKPKRRSRAIPARSMPWQSHPMVATWSPAPATRRCAFGTWRRGNQNDSSGPYPLGHAVAVTPDGRHVVSGSSTRHAARLGPGDGGNQNDAPGPYPLGQCRGSHTRWSPRGLRLLRQDAARLGPGDGETKTTLQGHTTRSVPWQSHPMVATWSPAPTTTRCAFGTWRGGKREHTPWPYRR